MAVGLDDFIVLANAMAALAAGASDEIETVEVCFAAAGALLTIGEIVSVGTLAPAAESLKWGLDAFKIALKGMGPDGVKAALGMAKGLWKVIKEVATDRKVALGLVKDTTAAIMHLARNVGEPVFNVFVAVIRSPMDFMNWVQTLRFFRRGAGCLLTLDSEGYEQDIMLASSDADKQDGLAVVFSTVMDFLAAEAYAGKPPACMGEDDFIEAVMKIDSLVGTTDAVKEFIHGIVRIEREVIPKFDLSMLKLDASALDGMVAMLKNGRNGNNIFYIEKSVAKNTDDLPLDEAEAIIGKFFRLIGDADEYETGYVLWRDMGKFMHATYSDHFITGLYHQLEIMDDLRKAGGADNKIKALEKCTDYEENGKTIYRHSDIVLENGHRIEAKNYARYSSEHRKVIADGLEKDLSDFMYNAKGNPDLLP